MKNEEGYEGRKGKGRERGRRGRRKEEGGKTDSVREREGRK